MGYLTGPLLTTGAPVTEAMYLLDFSSRAQGALLQMIERSALHVLELAAEDLPSVRKFMMRYDDLPLDFADATLVHVAAREGVNTVFTLESRSRPETDEEELRPIAGDWAEYPGRGGHR